MEGKVIVRAKIVRKPALLETLKALEVGAPRRFYSKDFKTQSIRASACTLEKTKIYGQESKIEEIKNILLEAENSKSFTQLSLI